MAKKVSTQKANSDKKTVRSKAESAAPTPKVSKKSTVKAAQQGPVEVKVKAPSFALPATGSQQLSLSDFKGKRLVLYFYPKDMTSGCTVESEDFQKLKEKFKKQKTEILGVSRDSLVSHEKFREKSGLTFDLISDSEEKLCKLFDVIKQKSLYGRKFMGIERSTFVIDENGYIRGEWRKVKVPGHAEAVLKFIEESL